VDIALGLHACGNATDYVIEQAKRHCGAYIVCPCCIGKLRFGLAGGSSFSADARDLPSLAPVEGATTPPQLPPLTHPRSQWMAAALRTNGADCDSAFAALAAAADVSHSLDATEAAVAAGFDERGHGAVARMAKMNIECDRSENAHEAGFAVALLKLLQAQRTAKNDLLLGVSRAARPAWAAAVDALAATAG
jgi:hypothetical protein